MVMLRCPCDRGPNVWGEIWWAGGGDRWVFYDDDKTSSTFAQEVERCSACGRRLEREEMGQVSAA